MDSNYSKVTIRYFGATNLLRLKNYYKGLAIFFLGEDIGGDWKVGGVLKKDIPLSNSLLTPNMKKRVTFVSQWKVLMANDQTVFTGVPPS